MRRLVFGLMVFAASVAMVGSASAQQPPPGLPSPRLQNVFPCGVKAGTSVEVTVTGFDVEDPEKLLFAHPGLKGEYISPPKDPTPDPKDPKKTIPAPKVNPAGPHKFKVTAAADVPLGVFDVRFVGKWGASNPRAFVVGDLLEVNEKEPNNDIPDVQKIEIGTTINGVISNPTDVDYAAFTGKKGQRIVVSCQASSIDSKAEPMIEIFDASGRKLTTNRNYRDNDAVADVVLPTDGEYFVRLFQFTYTAGGPDHVYRLSVSAAPWIDAVFPPVVEPGKPTPVTLYGRNLPGGQLAEGYAADGRPLEQLTVTITPPTDATANTKLVSPTHVEPSRALQDGFAYSLKGPGGASNPVTIYFARNKLVVKTKVAGSPETAEVVPAGSEVAGFLAKKGEKDWVAFTAKKGEKITIDLAAERIGASGDFYFSVRDGKDPKRDLSGEQDDDNDTLHPFGFYSRSSDPAPYQFTAPEDGKYLIAVACRESSYLNGPKATYRLRLGQPVPDFRAVVMPYSRFYQTGSAAWQGSSQAYYVFAQRQDGYTGSIAVSVEGLPAGVTAQPLTIGPAVRWGLLVLDVAPGAAHATAAFTVKLTGTDSTGKALIRSARPASVTWGVPQPDQQIPVVSRLDQSLVIAVRPEKALFSIKADLANAIVKPATGKEDKVKGPVIVMRQGDKSTVPVKVEWSVPEKPNVTLVAEPMAQNQQSGPVSVQITAQPTKDKPEVMVNVDAKSNAVPGAYTVVLRGTAQVPFAKDPMAKAKPNIPAEAFSTPIQVLVIPSALGRFTTGPLPNNTLKLGSSTDLPIKVERMHDFAGEYQVTFVPAKDATGVTAAEVVIPAGKDEVKLVLKTAADAKPGALAGTVVVTALYAGKYPVTYENKVSFNLAK
ncbi:PPC domain-containing protein [Gemmata sp. G18]|uniref:PPC domain-containing protein n=1 Tax=Gemmata palustris TaxID=2822762 RepID=A0ABS5BXY5_9BACT|nr:PPC domain-containing protein [Gemmata palustris]MBP3958530.1 PPC domain-containing protein [Gemmata palustris]